MTFTVLEHRNLYFDGDSVITDFSYLYNKLLNGEDISPFYVEKISEEIDIFNKYSNFKLNTKEHIKDYDHSWNIPIEYKNINVSEYCDIKFEEYVTNNQLNDNQIDERLQRIQLELSLFKRYNIEDLLKTTIYIVDKFKENNVVWGTGRGSSCCCYILYLIGLHDVDSVKYELDIGEFFR